MNSDLHIALDTFLALCAMEGLTKPIAVRVTRWLQTAAMIRAIAGEMSMKFDPWLAEHAEVAAWLYSEAERA